MKTDIDAVTEITLHEVRSHLRHLMESLYRRNPWEWRKTGKPSPEFVVEKVFDSPQVPEFPELGGVRSVGSIRLAFRESYTGDRVLAFVGGLASMIDDAYGGNREFFILDELDPQRFYNAARNVEIAAWMLENQHRPDETPYLLANSRADEPRNLSYERLFGKIVGLQDALARIVAERTSRTLRRALHGITTLFFFPI